MSVELQKLYLLLSVFPAALTKAPKLSFELFKIMPLVVGPRHHKQQTWILYRILSNIGANILSLAILTINPATNIGTIGIIILPIITSEIP